MFTTTNAAATAASGGGGGPVAAAVPPTFQIISTQNTHVHQVVGSGINGPPSSSSSTPVRRFTATSSTIKQPSVVSIVNGNMGVTSSTSTIPMNSISGTAMPTSGNIFYISATQPNSNVLTGQHYPHPMMTGNILLQSPQTVRLLTPNSSSLHPSLSAPTLTFLNNSNTTIGGASGYLRQINSPLVSSSTNFKPGICIDTPVLGRLAPLTIQRQQTPIVLSTAITPTLNHILVQQTQSSSITSNNNSHDQTSQSKSMSNDDTAYDKNKKVPSPLTADVVDRKIVATEEQLSMITSIVDDGIADETNNNQQDQEIELFVNNVVCSFALGCKLNLRKIAMDGAHVIYKREQAMVLMKIRKPYCSANVWSSGKVTVTGTTSEEDAQRGARRIARCIQRLGFKVKLRNYRVVNCLATCSMPWNIDIIKLSRLYSDCVRYEPEIHPGATVRLPDKAVLKVFTTGSVTLTAPSVERINTAINDFYPQLFECRKPRITTSNNNNDGRQQC